MLFSIIKCYQPIPKGRRESAKDPSPPRFRPQLPSSCHKPLLGMAKSYQDAHLTVQLHLAQLLPKLQPLTPSPEPQALLSILAPACVRKRLQLCTLPFPAAGPQELRRSKGCSD